MALLHDKKLAIPSTARPSPHAFPRVGTFGEDQQGLGSIRTTIDTLAALGIGAAGVTVDAEILLASPGFAAGAALWMLR
jgi:hypothetical protein